MPNKLFRKKGFTLLEVLVAMLIFGTTVTFLLHNMSQQQRAHSDITIKTIAHWVALNKMAETRMQKNWPSIGVTRGDTEMRDRTWYWMQTVSKTSEQKLRQVEIEVRYDEADENPATRFTGFIAEKKVRYKFTQIKGFSLIEIMIAMAILAFIGVGAMQLLDAATKSSDSLKETGDRLNEVQRAFLFLSNDLQQVTTRKVRDEYGDYLPSVKSDLQSSTPFIRLTRLGRRNPAQLPRSNLEHLMYTLEDRQLIRTSFQYTDGMPSDLALKRPVLSNVEDFKVKFFTGEEWQDYWPNAQVETEPGFFELPVAIRLSLELADWGVIERLYFVSDPQAKQEEGAE